MIECRLRVGSLCLTTSYPNEDEVQCRPTTECICRPIVVSYCPRPKGILKEQDWKVSKQTSFRTPVKEMKTDRTDGRTKETMWKRKAEEKDENGRSKEMLIKFKPERNEQRKEEGNECSNRLKKKNEERKGGS